MLILSTSSFSYGEDVPRSGGAQTADSLPRPPTKWGRHSSRHPLKPGARHLIEIVAAGPGMPQRPCARKFGTWENCASTCRSSVSLQFPPANAATRTELTANRGLEGGNGTASNGTARAGGAVERTYDREQAGERVMVRRPVESAPRKRASAIGRRALRQNSGR